jgi:hypothetical protein
MKKQLAVVAGVLGFMLSLSACSKPPATYYPLGEGRTWKYQIAVTTSSGETRAGELTVSNLAARELKGKRVTPQKYEMEIHGQPHTMIQYAAEDLYGVFIYAQQEANDVEPKISSTTFYTLKAPLKVGSSWDATVDSPGGAQVSAKATVMSIDEVVDVPAGTFRDCVKVRTAATIAGGKEVEVFSWYAPSVGQVKTITPLGAADDKLLMQLESFTK